VLGEKIFFNLRDNFFILQKHSQKQQTQATVASTLGVSISVNQTGGRKTKACEEKKRLTKLARSTSLIGLNSQLKLNSKILRTWKKERESFRSLNAHGMQGGGTSGPKQKSEKQLSLFFFPKFFLILFRILDF
jgi:hypothetical protein